jgi:EpsI family protein
VGALSLLWLVAWVLTVQVVHQAVLPLLLVAGAAALYGARGVGVTAPIAATFLLAVPLWESLTRPLQLLTVQANEALLAVAGLEGTVRGETITIPYGTFLVADTCAGLSYLMVSLVLGTFYAWLFLRRPLPRLTVVAVAGAIAIVGNWLRVFGLILIGYRTEMASPLMESHGTYGWIVFGVSLIPFFWIASRIEGWDRSLPAARAIAATDRPAPSAESTGFGSRLPATVAAAVLGPALYWILSALPADRTVSPLPAGLEPGPGWFSLPATVAVDSWRPAYEGADETRSRRWEREGGGGEARVDRVVYLEQRQGKELVGGENRIAPDSLTVGSRLLGPIGPEQRTVQEAVLELDTGLTLVWSWYVVAGEATPSASEAKLLGLRGFLRRRPVAELVAVSVPCPTGDCADAVPTMAHLVLGLDVRVEPADPAPSAP